MLVQGLVTCCPKARNLLLARTQAADLDIEEASEEEEDKAEADTTFASVLRPSTPFAAGRCCVF